MSVLVRSSLLDIETQGLERGSGIFEGAVLHLDTGVEKEYLLRPNLVEISKTIAQDRARLATSGAEALIARTFETWDQVFQHQFGSSDIAKISEADEFLGNALATNRFPHLRGGPGFLGPGPRLSVPAFLNQLNTELQGRTIWIANTAFEGSHLGAAAGAHGITLFPDRETRSSGPNFYVTGTEVNRARTIAQTTGDWSEVWTAYKIPVKPGTTAIRDIQDLTRALHSIGKNRGWTTAGPYVGTAVDTQRRLMGALTNIANINVAEQHLAVPDNRDQALVLRTTVGILEDLDRGDTRSARAYFGLFNQVVPALEAQNLHKRLGRAAADIADTGTSYQTAGYDLVSTPVTTPGGKDTIIRPAWNRIPLDTVEKVLDHIRPEYPNIDVDAVAAGPVPGGPVWSQVRPQTVVDNLTALKVPKMLKTGLGPGLAAGATALAVLGALGAASGNRTSQPSSGSVVSTTAAETAARLTAQEHQHQGVGHATRSYHTDFGSPYIGVSGTGLVFQTQDLQNRRERYLRETFANRHFDNYEGLFGVLGPFRNINKGYSFLPGGADIEARGVLRGRLKQVQLDNYKIKIEDADTITLQNRGITGWFGPSYSFRLAGIDAPEIKHGNRAAQPGADVATAVLEQLLVPGGTLVFDPLQSTYGRGLGVVYAGGRNVNLELIQRGVVKHLPYGKSDESMINYQVLKTAENRARANGLGIWSSPWHQAGAAVADAAGNTLTFNTLADPDKVVQNQSTMNTLRLMEFAQQQGQFGTAAAAEAALIGQGATLGADRFEAVPMYQQQSHYSAYVGEMAADISNFTRTSGGIKNRYKAAKYRGPNTYMALDTMGSTNHISNRVPGAIIKHRRIEQERAQQHINNQLFQRHNRY